MRNRIFVLIASVSAVLLSCMESGGIEAASLVACGVYEPSTHLCDRRDGNLYGYRKMPGGKHWMAENLRYGLPNSRCYGDDPENCKIYGRLYPRDNGHMLCPEGWEIPDMAADWDALAGEVKDNDLKARSGWEPYEGKDANGEDPYGFAALPGGAYRIRLCEENLGEGEYRDWLGKGEIAVFMALSSKYNWTISNNPDPDAEDKFCIPENAYVSVRCVKVSKQ